MLIETAICVPFLALTLFLVVSGTQMYRAAACAEAASAEGARWAAQHPTATDEEVAAHARRSVAGAENADVAVSREDLPEQDYTVRVVDRYGEDKSAEAKTVRTGITVEATVEAELLGFASQPFTSSHTGICSVEGVPR